MPKPLTLHDLDNLKCALVRQPLEETVILKKEVVEELMIGYGSQARVVQLEELVQELQQEVSELEDELA